MLPTDGRWPAAALKSNFVRILDINENKKNIDRAVVSLIQWTNLFVNGLR